MAKLDQNTERQYEKVASEESQNDNEKDESPEPYGLGVRHVQSAIIFVSLCVTFIARAHLSVTIVAMTDNLSTKTTIVNVTEGNTNATSNITEIELPDDMLDLQNVTLDYENRTNTNVICLNRTIGMNYEHNENETDVDCVDDDVFNNSIINSDSLNDTDEIQEAKDSIWNVYRTYAWPKSTQEMVLGAFFLGYMIMMFPMGVVSQRWGGKLPLQISLFSSGFICFFTPWLAVWGGYRAVSLTRVATGLTQAGTYPAIHTLIAKWVPLSERGRLGTYVYTGAMVGSVMAFHVSGFLVASSFGWPSVFWVTGVLCILCATLVTLFVAPTPQQHRFITEDERKFILGSVKEHVERKRAVPWKAIFTSVPVWAAFAAHIGTSITFLFFFTQIPTYLHYVVGLNIKNSGLLSSLPYLANFLVSVGMGILSDYWVNRKIVSLKNVRIISNTIANIGPALCLFGVSFTSDPVLAVALLIICMGTHAGTHTGWMVNYIDLAPNFSGTLMATGNTLMNFNAVGMPVLVSYIVTDVTDVHQWRIIQFVVGTIALVCNTIFVVFMSADVQPWNDIPYEPAGQDDPEAEKDVKDEKETQS
ncbi:putative inorganic phosphate cotransporter [Pectinophora gossypiella]|uniref:putative inorganic phosphate cotransporter n=1 Tax=Pectinophora gossypiella TaxID=13191 RepID=UPI00214E4D99|nr:putative inorganic phosphate cotransporter [Pectinophora gossypiella]